VFYVFLGTWERDRDWDTDTDRGKDRGTDRDKDRDTDMDRVMIKNASNIESVQRTSFTACF
jgi:hypothetical protein